MKKTRNFGDKSRSGVAETLEFTLTSGSKTANQYVGVIELPFASDLENDSGSVLGATLTRKLPDATNTSFKFKVYLYDRDVTLDVSNNDGNTYYNSSEMTKPSFMMLEFDSANANQDMTDASTATLHISRVDSTDVVPTSFVTEPNSNSIWAVFVANDTMTMNASETFTLRVNISH